MRSWPASKAPVVNNAHPFSDLSSQGTRAAPAVPVSQGVEAVRAARPFWDRETQNLKTRQQYVFQRLDVIAFLLKTRLLDKNNLFCVCVTLCVVKCYPKVNFLHPLGVAHMDRIAPGVGAGWSRA